MRGCYFKAYLQTVGWQFGPTAASTKPIAKGVKEGYRVHVTRPVSEAVQALVSSVSLPLLDLKRTMEGRWLPAALALLLVNASFGFYLPGVTPVEYEPGDSVTIKVNSIKSVRTAIPFDYYSLMHCRPVGQGAIKADVENFGEILWGDIIKPSRYAAHMKKNVGCTKLCTTKPKEKDPSKISRQLKKLKTRIDDEYRGHLILDNLPVSEVYIWEGRKEALYYKLGYPIGVPGNKTRDSLVNNHLAFTIKYHKPDSGIPGFRIVGFEVVPYSIDSAHIESHCGKGMSPTCNLTILGVCTRTLFPILTYQRVLSCIVPRRFNATGVPRCSSEFQL